MNYLNKLIRIVLLIVSCAAGNSIAAPFNVDDWIITDYPGTPSSSGTREYAYKYDVSEFDTMSIEGAILILPNGNFYLPNIAPIGIMEGTKYNERISIDAWYSSEGFWFFDALYPEGFLFRVDAAEKGSDVMEILYWDIIPIISASIFKLTITHNGGDYYFSLFFDGNSIIDGVMISTGLDNGFKPSLIVGENFYGIISSLTDVSFYNSTTIPEQSNVAMVFGFIAIAFVGMKMRKTPRPEARADET